MRIIILTNDPCAREVFDLARKSNTVLTMDFRNGETGFNRPNGLTYTLGHRYVQLHHHFFPAAVLRRVKKWSHPDLPLILIVDKSAPITALRSAVLRDYPLTEFVMQDSKPCAA